MPVIRKQAILKILFPLLVLFLGVFETLLYAQSYAHVGIGGNYYDGELSGGLEEPQANITAGYTYRLDQHFFIHAEINVGRITGEYQPGDNFRGIRLNPEINKYFVSNTESIQAGIQWEWFRWYPFHSYVGVGVGFLSYEIADSQGRNILDIPSTRLPNETYDTRAMYVPLQVGVVLFHRKRVNIVLEQSWNITTTDYLDNIGYLGNNGSDTIIRRMLKVRYQFSDEGLF